MVIVQKVQTLVPVMKLTSDLIVSIQLACAMVMVSLMAKNAFAMNFTKAKIAKRKNSVVVKAKRNVMMRVKTSANVKITTKVAIFAINQSAIQALDAQLSSARSTRSLANAKKASLGTNATNQSARTDVQGGWK